MKIRRLVGPLLASTLLAVGVVTPAPAGGTSSFGATSDRYEIGEAITFRFVNDTDEVVTMHKLWKVGAWNTDQEIAFYQWPDDQLEVAPGDSREWTWHQLGPACYGECVNVSPGEQVEAGKYVVMTELDGVPVSDAFQIGSYFTLGFRERPALRFVVFVAKQAEIERMTAEAEAEEKTLVVGGIVRRGRAPYNPDWKFRMGPRSIELGEVWIEVCDGSPHYVQRHLDEWAGDMWCPWGSYVAKAGA